MHIRISCATNGPKSRRGPRANYRRANEAVFGAFVSAILTLHRLVHVVDTDFAKKGQHEEKERGGEIRTEKRNGPASGLRRRHPKTGIHGTGARYSRWIVKRIRARVPLIACAFATPRNVRATYANKTLT